jgi:glyoxylase-like metal-dependent hydrolase (beta-lactamase superfamily II)
MRVPFVAATIIILPLVIGVWPGSAQNSGRAQSTGEVEILPVQGNVYLIARDGANIAVQIGGDGVLLVDSGVASMADKVLAAIQKIAKPNAASRLEGKIRFIVNTNADPDHTGANEILSKAGIGTVTNDPLNRVAPVGADPAILIAHEKVADRLLSPPGGATPAPIAAVPQNIYTGAGESFKDLYFDDEGIEIIHAPSAHTDGDSIVYFRRSDVLSAGDVYVTTGYPVIDVARGGSVEGVIAGLNHLLRIAIPGHSEEDGTLIIPGHGRLSDEADVAEYRDMIVILKDRIQAMVKRGATLDQVKAARLTRDYDPEYGKGGPGSATTDKFVEAAYKSLAGKK